MAFDYLWHETVQNYFFKHLFLKKKKRKFFFPKKKRYQVFYKCILTAIGKKITVQQGCNVAGWCIDPWGIMGVFSYPMGIHRVGLFLLSLRPMVSLSLTFFLKKSQKILFCRYFSELNILGRKKSVSRLCNFENQFKNKTLKLTIWS